MTDVLTPAQRRLNMSRIRGRDTKPEMIVRRGLHALGLRYKLHDKTLPGRPDLVLPRFKTVVFVHGCFWHAHGCSYSTMPKTRTGFWRKKIEGNAARDRRTLAALHDAGWRVVFVWECAVRRKPAVTANGALRRTAGWIRRGRGDVLEIGEAS